MMNSQNKVIIFTRFAKMAKILIQELSEYNPLLISGEVSPQDRQRVVNLFRDDPKFRILISTEAGAYGLNLQVASYVIHYDSPWSVSKLMQREDRAHRIGQDKAVTVYSLVAKDTIDEYVEKMLAKKQQMSADVLGDASRMEEAGLSIQDIESILRIKLPQAQDLPV